MKKIITAIILSILVIVGGVFAYYKFNKEVSSDETIHESTEGILTTLTLEDTIQTDTIWCGTFQLIWNDLKNELAKQNIVFNPQTTAAENLNKETFTVNDLSDEYFYKKYGVASPEMKVEIEKAIKEKFNETSDILDDFNWERGSENDYFLYAMLKREFQFEKAFEELDKASFGQYENVSYFGIKKNTESSELRDQVDVLYYNSKDDFAIRLNTKQKDEVVFCKNPEGKTFNEIYSEILKQTNSFKGKKYVQESDFVKVPNIKMKEKSEFSDLQNRPFLFSNGQEYVIEKAVQTIQFDLDKTGGKIKSEAGMMVRNTSIVIEDEAREFAIDDTFAIFLVEHGKTKPYFAAKISDITKFQ